MSNYLQKDNKGFTIIEVLIVLAIAGLIMLIVFLAIPALRRNQQNTAMRSEASRILSALTEFEANANGNMISSQADLNGVAGSVGGLQQLASTGTFRTSSSTVLTTAAAEGVWEVVKGTCNGSTLVVGPAGTRTYAIGFKTKGGALACMQS